MKKIFIYVDSMKPAGGIERVISNLVNEWTKSHQVVIIVKDEAKSFYSLDPRIHLKSIDNPLKLNMKNRWSRVISLVINIVGSHKKLKKIISENNPDVIYTANPVNSLEIYLLGKKYLRKLIISEHGSKLGYNQVYNFIKKIVYPKAYKISVPTSLDTELYTKEKLPAVYIPHLSTFKNPVKLKPKGNWILNIGRFTKDKQQMKLLEIWNDITSEKLNGEWKLMLVGKGEEESILKEYINKHNLTETVVIEAPRKDVSKFFEKASIFAFTSQYEGFGMVLLESMSFGVPCISFDCPSGPRDIIKNNVDGYLIKDQDLNEYKTHLVKLMNNKEIREKFSRESYEKANKWDNENILAMWEVLFAGTS